MSEQLLSCLIAVATNLAGMLVIYSFMAFCLARLHQHGRGIFGAIVTIVVAQLFWIVPALLIADLRNPENAASYALWFGNWVVAGFGVVLLGQTVKGISRQLEDSARLDGLGLLGTWWHVIFPYVKRDLGLIAVFTVMATLLPFWGFITLPDADDSVVLFQRALSPATRIGTMVAGSLVGSFPAVAIFLFTKRHAPKIAGDPRA